LYSLDHGRLNLPLPPSSLWMNMGYWQGLNNDINGQQRFKSACEALLDEVLADAGLKRNNSVSRPATRRLHRRALIDLGFGCGDQTLHLMYPSSCFASYIGITRDRSQFDCARERISSKRTKNTVELFCADAADPRKWNAEITKAVQGTTAEADEIWVLALDTLYHFSPSRWPIISFASQELQASFMAFDLCLTDCVTSSQRLILKLITRLMGAPWSNFVTEDQYRAKLVEAGYTDITIRDVSEHVFGHLAEYMDEQHQKLQLIGYGLGPFHVAKWTSRWWAQSRVVKGIIVVARK
ncbi:hypothetical protein BDV96DRAFT_480575, partial [Lophiotrema nucula]